jgi:hypothetical protein
MLNKLNELKYSQWPHSAVAWNRLRNDKLIKLQLKLNRIKPTNKKRNKRRRSENVRWKVAASKKKKKEKKKNKDSRWSKNTAQVFTQAVLPEQDQMLSRRTVYRVHQNLKMKTKRAKTHRVKRLLLHKMLIPVFKACRLRKTGLW